MGSQAPIQPAFSSYRGQMSDMNAKPRVVIIGCGYVGSALGRRLVVDGYDVVGTTTSSQRVAAIRALGITPVVLDTADVGRLRHVLEDRDAAVLCVAPRADRRDYRVTYLQTARNLIEAARLTAVSRFIYTGSTRVYPQNDGEWVDENSPTQPTDENARILLETEQVLLDGAKSVGADRPALAAVLRLGGIYGPGRGALDSIFRSAGKQRDDGDFYLNRIHVDDIVAALAALLGSDFQGVLNLCDDHPQTRQSFFDAALASEGLAPIDWTSPSGRQNRGKRVRNDLIKTTLGLVLRHPRRSLYTDR